MVGLRWFRGKAGAVEEERWIDQDKAREVLAATEHLAEGAGCDRCYTVLEDRGRVVILDADEALVLSGCWVTREILALRMTEQLAEEILADARLDRRLERGFEGWDITPAIRFAMAVQVYVSQGYREGGTGLNRRQYDALWRGLEPELGTGHLRDYRPRYREGLTIREFWNELDGLREPQPCFEMIDWNFEQPVLTRIAVQVPEIPWLSRTDGIPQISAMQRFDAYLAYTYGSKLEGVDLMVNTSLKEMTQYAQCVGQQVGAILYPVGELHQKVVKPYQLKAYPQDHNLYWVPTYTLYGVQPTARELEVTRWMRSIFEGVDNDEFERLEPRKRTMYRFFPPHEYGLYWSFFYEVYPSGSQPFLQWQRALDFEEFEWKTTSVRSSSTELQVLADTTPHLEGGPFVPCLAELMDQLGLADCSIWVDQLRIYPYLEEHPPPRHLVGRVYDFFRMRELQGSLRIQQGANILFQQAGDKMIVPPVGEIYQAIDRWHAIP